MRPHQLSLSYALAASLCLLLSTSTSRAQTSSADKAAAEALFNQGRELVEQGRFVEACPKFEASQRLDEGLGTLLHLADCYEKSGKLASAWATFKEVDSLSNARNDPERGQIARVRATALEPQLIRLVIIVPTDRPAGFEVTRNGVTIPPELFGSPAPVDAGSWLVRATAPGHEPFEATVSLTQTITEPFELQIPPLVPIAAPAQDVTPVETPPPADLSTEPTASTGDTGPNAPRNGQRTIALMVGSVGVLAAVISSVFTARAVQRNSDSRDECTENLCSPEGLRRRDDAFQAADIATVAGIAGAVGVGAGAVLYFTAPTSKDSAVGIAIGGKF